MLESALILSFSLLLDQLIGEPRRLHPLVGFGWCATQLELVLNQRNFRRFKGIAGIVILVAPLVLLLIFAQQLLSHWIVELVVVYLAIGRKSLMQHAKAVLEPLNNSDTHAARKRLSYIVSRDTESLDEKDIVKAAIESVVENSNDAIFAAIFWYLIAGAPGVLGYRLVNTLDAMWGYKNSRYYKFGWAAARLDDLMNWVPARLTVITFALLSSFNRVMKTAFKQGALCSSPNAGPVMSAGASSLNIKLGGDAFYQQKLIAKPVLGYGNEAQISDISKALLLINKSVFLWLVVIFVIVILIEVI